MDCFRVRPDCREGKKKYISGDGFIETYVVNETGEDVWFDDFMVMSTTSPIMQETHGACPEKLRDPWGLELTGIGFQYGGGLSVKNSSLRTNLARGRVAALGE